THPDAGEGYTVYKPQRGEAPLHDFPTGTLYQREFAAYVVSQALRWGLVPPTVVREEGLEAGLGVLQLFVVHNPAHHYFTLKEGRDEDMRRIALFDWLINNADRKGGHCLIDVNGRIWCIDHGIAFHAEDKLRSVIWDYQATPVPQDLLADIERFAGELDGDTPLHDELASLLSDREFETLRQRAALILRERVYPLPPPYRPYPWPMI
ncbi:MAG TPA: hypothetical protein VI759_03275, partial [Dehalococcoidia bacterium]|nr:hypothetical protein [Dehalococcoidia bacterium]